MNEPTPDPRHRRILTDLLALPTAPFAEDHVIAYVRDFCRDRPALRPTVDRAGNLLIRVGPARRRPIVLVAHMDHPGFIAEELTAPPRTGVPGRLRARWHGSVHPEYFDNADVRFFTGGRWVHGRVIRRATIETNTPRYPVRVVHADIEVDAPVAAGSPGMWDFPDPQIHGQRLRARGCDDVAGVAAILAAMDVLSQDPRRGSLAALLTRAEEVGFAGAIAACRNGTLPPGAFMISIECSPELPGVSMGDGPILRVGDYLSVFSPAAVAWCRVVADDLAAADPSFIYQRKLMDGGVCEATVFGEFGYAAMGLSIPLGNYHNMNRRRRALAPEVIHLADWDRLVRWFLALATTGVKYDGCQPGLRRRLLNLEKRNASDLRRSAARCRALFR